MEYHMVEEEGEGRRNVGKNADYQRHKKRFRNNIKFGKNVQKV